MTFTTPTFFILFGLVFFLYWGLRDRMAQNVLLVAASYVFYGWWDWHFCWLMFGSSMLDYFVGLGLEKQTNQSHRKILLTVGMCGNLGLLGYFKYFNFFAESFQVAAAQLGWQVSTFTVSVILPVGISFYTFQTMCYSIDIYRRHLKATTHVVEYLAYVSFFPQLVAGPIERATHLLPQFLSPRIFSHEKAVEGLRQALWGFFKKWSWRTTSPQWWMSPSLIPRLTTAPNSLWRRSYSLSKYTATFRLTQTLRRVPPACSVSS